VIADLCAHFHWPLSEVMEMDATEILVWHAQARRQTEAAHKAAEQRR